MGGGWVGAYDVFILAADPAFTGDLGPPAAAVVDPDFGVEVLGDLP